MAAHIILFQDANFHGAHKQVCDTEPNLNASDDDSVNDSVSSVVILSGNWKFFRNSGFDDAYPVVLGPGLYRFVGDVGIANDDTSSLMSVADPPTVTGDPLDAHDHCSLLKTILARFCGQDRPFLSDRVHASHTFDAFLTGMPRMARTLRSPALTEAAFRPTRRSVARGIRTPPMSRKTMAGDVAFRDVTGMLARMLGRY